MNLVGRHGSAFDSLRVFEAITFAGLDPDTMAFVTIVSIFCRHRLVDEAVSLVRRMAIEFGMKPTMLVLVPILQELERRGEPLKIEQMLRSAKELYNLSPDPTVLSILIKAHAKAGNLDQAVAIVSQLSDATLSDEALCHEVLRAMFLRKAKMSVVEQFWALLRSRPSGATAYEYGMMMRIYEAQQEWQLVIRLLQGQSGCYFLSSTAADSVIFYDQI
jgi:pentatricopeptide repeat protein